MMRMMGDDALFNLRWDAQRSALLGSMASLYREEAFVDTTIVADNKIFKAHKLLLSASSSYLRNILESVPASQHAVICMPQVSSIDMGNLLRFIYEGQIKINRRSLRPFLAIAKLLRIKGMDFELNEDLDAALPPPSNNHHHVQNAPSLPSPINTHHHSGTKRPAPPPSSSVNGEANNNIDDSNNNDDEPPSSKRASPHQTNKDDEMEGGRKSPTATSTTHAEDSEAGEDVNGECASASSSKSNKGSTGSVASGNSPSSHTNNNNSNVNVSESNNSGNNNLERPSSSRSVGGGSTHSGEMDMAICSDAGEESNQSGSMEPLQLISLSRLAAASNAAAAAAAADDDNSEGALNLVDHHGDSHHHHLDHRSHHHALQHHHRMMMADRDDRDDRDEMMSNGAGPEYDDDDDDDHSFSMSIQPEVSLRESDESYSVHSNDRRSHHSSPHSGLEIKQVPNLLTTSAFAGLPIGGSSAGMSMTPFAAGSALHNLHALKNFNKLRPLIPKAHQQSSSAAAAAAAAAASQFQSMSEGILMRMMKGEPPHLAVGGGGGAGGAGSGGNSASGGSVLTSKPGGGSSSSSSSVLSHHTSSFFDLGHGDTSHHHGAGGGGVAAGLRKQKRYVQCTSCSKVLSSLSALKRHMEDVHCARIQGKCLLCGRVYSSRNSLLTHVYSAHKKHHDYKAVARIIRESDFEQFATA